MSILYNGKISSRLGEISNQSSTTYTDTKVTAIYITY